MSVQKDFQPGFDLSPLSTATFAQLIQAIANIAPLANIGGVVFQAGTSSNSSIPQGTLGSPSITDNPRFARYWWINTVAMPAVPYLYNSTSGNWVSTTVAAASIGPTQLAAHATVLDHFFNATVAVAGDALKILRYDSAGDLIEAVSLASILTSNSVPLTALNKTGATDGQVLQYKTSDGLVLFRDLTASVFAAGSIGLSKLAVATVGYIMQMGASEWAGVEAKTALDGKGLYLSSLGNNNSVGGVPGPLEVVTRNAVDTANEWMLPIISEESGALTAAGTLTAAAGLETLAHGLGTTPKLFKVFLVNTTTEHGWAVNDELPIECVWTSSDGDGPGVWYKDNTNIYIRWGDTGNINTKHKTSGANVVITRANWKARAYAWI